MSGRKSDGRDKELGTLFNGDINQLIELSFGKILTIWESLIIITTHSPLLVSIRGLLYLAGISTNLWKQQVHTKGCRFIVQIGSQCID